MRGYFKKSLGQNFLKDKNIIKKIVSVVKIKDKNIIEIGPGTGSLTEEILKKKPKNLLIIEKDFNLVKELKYKYFKYNNLKIINKDILKFNLEKILYEGSIIFGNLPYNISSQILIKILKFKSWPPKFDHLIFMFQKELGEKILGKFRTKFYGRLSILSNYRLEAHKKFLISPNCFFPKPDITSVLIHFKPKKRSILNIKNISNIEYITNRFFSSKRKMVNKVAKKILSANQIENIKELNLNLRPSEIKPELYYKIAELIEKK